MTQQQRYVSDLAARWLIGFLFLVQAGQGTYMASAMRDLHDHEVAEGVHETPLQKMNRTRSIAADVVAAEAVKTRDDLREIKQLIEKLREEIARK